MVLDIVYEISEVRAGADDKPVEDIVIEGKGYKV